MTKSWLLRSTIALVALPAIAGAGDEGVKRAGTKLVNYAIAVADAQSQGAEVANHGPLQPRSADCEAALADAEAAGAAADTRLYAYGWPKSTPSYEYDSMLGAS